MADSRIEDTHIEMSLEHFVAPEFRKRKEREREIRSERERERE
jgi:hypothetical protein